MSKENIIHGRTSVYNCNYHIVFTTKYRRKVLNINISQYFKQVLNEVAKEKEFTDNCRKAPNFSYGDIRHKFSCII